MLMPCALLTPQRVSPACRMCDCLNAITPHSICWLNFGASKELSIEISLGGTISLHPITGLRLTFGYCRTENSLYFSIFTLFLASFVLPPIWMKCFIWQVVCRRMKQALLKCTFFQSSCRPNHAAPALPVTLVCHHWEWDSFMLPSSNPL